MCHLRLPPVMLVAAVMCAERCWTCCYDEGNDQRDDCIANVVGGRGARKGARSGMPSKQPGIYPMSGELRYFWEIDRAHDPHGAPKQVLAAFREKHNTWLWETGIGMYDATDAGDIVETGLYETEQDALAAIIAYLDERVRGDTAALEQLRYRLERQVLSTDLTLLDTRDNQLSRVSRPC
jgi:hypothetical protein